MACTDRVAASGNPGNWSRTRLAVLGLGILLAFPAGIPMVAGAAERPGTVPDTRHGHNRPYPPAGSLVAQLPPGYREVRHAGTTYYYDQGVWYVASASRFLVTLPPEGLIVPFLPPYTTTVWVGTDAHYYAGGVYYLWRAAERVYAVAPTPAVDDITPDAAEAPDLLRIVPELGQDEATQAADRYACHRWAYDQSGFDPAEPGGSVPQADYPLRRNDYRQALKDCLLARGYRPRP